MILFFLRKKSNKFSIENVFGTIQKALEEDGGLEIERWEAPYPSTGLVNRLRIARALKKLPADIYHNTGDINFAHLFLRRKKVVLTVHDCEFVNRASGLKKEILRWFWLVLPVKYATVVTVISTATKNELISHTRCSPHKIRIIPNPVSTRFTYSPKPFSVDKPTILQLGTKKNKNIERLIMALEGLSVHLRIIGELNNDQVVLLNKTGVSYTNDYNLTDEEIKNEYLRADIVTLISTEEGFGLPIIEANAIGRVVLTSNCSSMPEVAGKAAHLVNPLSITSIKKGIVEVIEDESLRDRLIEAGLQNVKRYHPTHIAAQYKSIYKDLLK